MYLYDVSKMDEIRMAAAADAKPLSVVKLRRTGWPEQLSRVPMHMREYV